MEARKGNRVVKPVFMVLLHLSIAGIIVGTMLFLRFLVETNYRADSWGTRYEDSNLFARAYEDSWYNAAQLITVRELLGPKEELTEDKIIELEILIEGERLPIRYRLGDINRWYTKGISTYEESVTVDKDSRPLEYISGAADGEENTGTEPMTVRWLQEEYAPLDHTSVYEIARDYEMTVDEINTFTENMKGQILYIGACVVQYHQLDKLLKEENTNFRYYAEKSDGTVYTNMSGIRNMKEAEDAEVTLDVFWKWDSGTGADYYNFGNNGNLEMLQQNVLKQNWMSYAGDDGDWTVVTGVDTAYPAKDVFWEQRGDFERIRPLFTAGIVLAVVSLILYFISFIVLTVLAGRRPGSDELVLFWVDRMKTETALLFFGALALALLFADYAVLMAISSMIRPGGPEFWLAVGMAAAAAMISNMGLISGWLSLTRRIKAGTLWSNSILAVLVRAVKTVWEERTVTLRTAVYYVLFLLINLFLLASRNGGEFLLAVAMDAVIGLLILRSAAQRQKISEGIARITDGDLDYKIPTEELKGDSRKLAEAINNIGEGLKHAVDKSLKSERFKTDLITNVSHDIKTPLTSIINYVDLMKRENIPNEKVQGYLNILEAKSQRLKNLTEDLVEASKVSSGNISLEFMNMDFVELVNQTNGEFEERFAAKELQLVTNLPPEPVYVLADGRRLWRVVENLYNNVAKYAMHGSRVYVDLTADASSMTFSVKNISEQALNINAEELTERFVRGDVSRTTEGSGLGLSIAKNLTELQKGTFEIYLDGDLFRVTITFPRVEE